MAVIMRVSVVVAAVPMIMPMLVLVTVLFLLLFSDRFLKGIDFGMLWSFGVLVSVTIVKL